MSSPDKPKPATLTRDDLDQLGAFMWGLSYAETQDDREAGRRVEAATRHIVDAADDGGAETEEIVLRAFASARWHDQGRPVIKLSHRLAAALIATDVHPEFADEIRAPWKAFIIEVPNGLIPVPGGDDGEHVAFVLVQETTDVSAPGRHWTLLAYTNRARAMTNKYAASPCHVLQPGTPGWDTEWSNEQLDDDFKHAVSRVLFIVGRLVANACLAISGGGDTALTPVRTSPRRGRGRTFGKTPPEILLFELGRDVTVDVDCRPAIREYLSRKPGSAPTVQTLVRGHYKHQPYGPRASLRRRQWIPPYWRGPDGMPVVVRAHVLRAAG